MRRALIAILALGALGAGAARPAGAQDSGASSGDGEVGVWVGTRESVRIVDRTPGGGAPARVCRAYIAVRNPGGDGLINIERPREMIEGGGYWLGCEGDLITEWTPFIYIPGVPPVTTEDEIIAAAVHRATARLDTPDPEFSPPPTSPMVVGVDVWLWLPDQDFENSAEVEAEITDEAVIAAAGSMWARAWAVTTRNSVQWDMGDGTVLRCTGPAYAVEIPYADQVSDRDCYHVFESDGAVTVATTVMWDVMVESSESGGPALFDGGVPGPTVLTDLEVIELQAELVAPDRGR